METNALDCYPVEWSGERDGTAEVYADFGLDECIDDGGLR